MPTPGPPHEGADAPWMRLKHRLRERWGDERLSDAELDALRADREALLGHLHAMSGRERAELERDLDSLARDTQFAW